MKSSGAIIIQLVSLILLFVLFFLNSAVFYHFSIESENEETVVSQISLEEEINKRVYLENADFQIDDRQGISFQGVSINLLAKILIIIAISFNILGLLFALNEDDEYTAGIILFATTILVILLVIMIILISTIPSSIASQTNSAQTSVERSLFVEKGKLETDVSSVGYTSKIGLGVLITTISIILQLISILSSADVQYIEIHEDHYVNGGMDDGF